MHNTQQIADRITKILESVFEDEGMAPEMVMLSIHGIDYARMVSPRTRYIGGETVTAYVTEDCDDGTPFPARRVTFHADMNTVPPEELGGVA